jgi:hypothetical protein
LHFILLIVSAIIQLRLSATDAHQNVLRV